MVTLGGAGGSACQVTLLLVLVHAAAATPRVDKVEPPNWWVPHTRNPVQLLLTGSDLQHTAVTTSAKGFKIDVRQSSANGHYLFVYLDIAKTVPPGAYRFRAGES